LCQNIGTGFQAFTQEQGQAFDVCLAEKAFEPVKDSKGGVKQLMLFDIQVCQTSPWAI